MGRKVTENHTITEQEKGNAAEELIKQQNATEEFVMGAEPEDTQKPEEEAFSGTVVLTGAATYLDSGTRYFKNKPVSITDKEAYEHLVKTGLFIRL